MGKTLVIKGANFSANAVSTEHLLYEGRNLTFSSDAEGINTGLYITDSASYPEYLIAIKFTMLTTPLTKAVQILVNTMSQVGGSWRGIVASLNNDPKDGISTMNGYKTINATNYLYYRYKDGVFTQKIGNGEWEATSLNTVNSVSPLTIGYNGAKSGEFLVDARIDHIMILNNADTIPEL